MAESHQSWSLALPALVAPLLFALPQPLAAQACSAEARALEAVAVIVQNRTPLLPRRMPRSLVNFL